MRFKIIFPALFLFSVILFDGLAQEPSANAKASLIKPLSNEGFYDVKIKADSEAVIPILTVEKGEYARKLVNGSHFENAVATFEKEIDAGNFDLTFHPEGYLYKENWIYGAIRPAYCSTLYNLLAEEKKYLRKSEPVPEALSNRIDRIVRYVLWKDETQEIREMERARRIEKWRRRVESRN